MYRPSYTLKTRQGICTNWTIIVWTSVTIWKSSVVRPAQYDLIFFVVQDKHCPCRQMLPPTCGFFPKGPSTRWDVREIFVRFWPWDFCDTTSNHLWYNVTHLWYNVKHLWYNVTHLWYNVKHLWYNVTHLWYNVKHLRTTQTKSHKTLIVWTRFDQRQTFVRFCSTMFHEDGACSKMPNKNLMIHSPMLARWRVTWASENVKIMWLWKWRRPLNTCFGQCNVTVVW
jgi:hypothetical protein